MSIHDVLYQCFTYGVPLSTAGAIYGIRWKEGLWGNTLAVFAVLFSALLAVGWWESLAILFCQYVPKGVYVADFLCFWAIFLLSLSIICEITTVISRVQVKYDEQVEKIGNGIASTLLVVLLLGIYQFSLELAPVGEPASATAPARDSIQTKAFRLLTAGNLASFTQVTPFDKNGEFRQDHFERRRALMDQCVNQENKSVLTSIFYDGETPPRKN